MATELTRRATTSSALATPISAGAGANVDDLTFNGPVALTHRDMPTTFPTGTALTLASDTPTPTNPTAAPDNDIASIARQHPKPYRRADGTVVQRRTSWAALPKKFVTATAERELAPTGQGAYRPNGPWHLTRRETRALDTHVKKRVGTVPTDPPAATATSTPREAHAADPYASETERFPEGANAIAYLPSEVRRSLYARVPNPLDFDGRVAQYQHDNSIEVTVMRRTHTTAVVAIGTRTPTATSWNVTMLTYDFNQHPHTEERA